MSQRDFIVSCLLPMLGCDTADDIVDYILSMEYEDFDEFMQGIVDKSNPEHLDLLEKLRNCLYGEGSKTNNVDLAKQMGAVSLNHNKQKVTQNTKPKQPSTSKNTVKKESKIKKSSTSSIENNSTTNENEIDTFLQNLVERVKYNDDEYINSLECPLHKIDETVSEENLDGEEGIKNTIKLEYEVYNPDNEMEEEQGKNKHGSAKKSKKIKFINFFDGNLEPALRKGRHPCQCEAKRHKLINNCFSCGRIVCEQEGSGPCFFCDEIVCTKEERDILDTNTKQSQKLYNQLMDQKKSKEWKKAVELRDRLVQTDKLGDGKHVIYDDQTDYFDVNNWWSTKEEKDRIEKMKRDFYNTKHKSVRDNKVQLNFSPSGVTATLDDSYTKFENKMLPKVKKAVQEGEKFFEDQKQLLAQFPPAESGEAFNLNINKSKEYLLKAKDKLTVNDRGMCLSMHQPYASLLIAGIKKHEGRSWSTTHRGPLWIAATTKTPDEDEIMGCEEMYRVYYDDYTLEFPKSYPTSCLLGCVYLEDCLSQNEYKIKYPNGESESPYVFICSYPVALTVYWPISGDHKIYNLKKGMLKKAKAALLASLST